MENTIEGQRHFQISLKGHKKSLVLSKKRHLLGSSRYCDFVLEGDDVSEIHAVIENIDGKVTLYDMDSEQGTFVNGEKIVNKVLSREDDIKLGSIAITFEDFKEESVPLDMLAPRFQSNKRSRDIVYPLSKDPRAEFSKYIFEDSSKLYPIFHYDQSASSVEIITTYKKRIFNVSFLPKSKSSYYFSGVSKSKQVIEFPYFGPDEKLHIADINDVFPVVHTIEGFDTLLFTDEGVKSHDGHQSFSLKSEEMLRMKQGDIEIFLRSTDIPPKVDRAPILRRDNDFGKILLLVFFFVTGFITLMNVLEVDKEVEEEKAPERLARIIHRNKKMKVQKPRIIKTKPIPLKKAQQSITKPEKNKDAAVSQTTSKSTLVTESSTTKSSNQNPRSGEPKKGEPRKSRKNKSKGQSAVNSNNVAKKSGNKSSKGRVDSYKSLNFKASLNNLLAKGGNQSAKLGGNLNSESNFQSDTLETGTSADVKQARIKTRPGSLSNFTKGRLDNSRGVKGLVSKKNIYTAGLPFKRVVLGGMDPNVIRQILIEHIPQFRFCYQKQLDVSRRAFTGIVRLDFMIGATGHVTRAEVVSASDSMPVKVRGCVANVLKGIRFPRPLGGGVVEVNQPFNFYPSRK
ncbi:MAG: AgmX/PglI C-terminal domain-containing protein [Bacteriovoracaceae bacterium]